MESQPVVSFVARKVTNGFILNIVRQNLTPGPNVMAEERVFNTWNDVVSFLSAEQFI